MTDTGQWYAIVDGAADARLYDLVSESRQHECLYTGDFDKTTLRALPHIATLDGGSRLSTLWNRHESGRFWGILVQSKLGFAAMRRHCRQFTTVCLPLGQIVMFRYWDPRVFLPFATTEGDEGPAKFFSRVESVIADMGQDGRKHLSWPGGLRMTDLPIRKGQGS